MGAILGNDPSGFYCGEVNGVFRPHRRHHFNPICNCGDPSCTIWPDLKKQGRDRWLDNLADRVGNNYFFIDSSKNYDWMFSEVKKNARYDVKHVLLWKSPESYALSRYKRGRMKRWKSSYVNYYRRYLQIVDECIAVHFTQFTQAPETVLSELCEHLDIPYFEGKTDYWDKRHHSVFGNDSAVMHLHGSDSEALKAARDKLEKKSTRSNEQMDAQHQRIYDDNAASLPEDILSDIKNDEELNAIVNQLRGKGAIRLLDTSNQKPTLGTRVNALGHLSIKKAKEMAHIATGARRY